MLPLFVFKQDSANKINSKDASTRTVIDPKSSLSLERKTPEPSNIGLDHG